jgi:hypothetical protein
MHTISCVAQHGCAAGQVLLELHINPVAPPTPVPPVKPPPVPVALPELATDEPPAPLLATLLPLDAVDDVVLLEEEEPPPVADELLADAPPLPSPASPPLLTQAANASTAPSPHT